MNKNLYDDPQRGYSATQLAEHPTVAGYLSQTQSSVATIDPLDTGWLEELCRRCGADDVGFVNLESPELDKERAYIQQCFPKTKSLISIVCRMNRENVRNPARSLANNEFHHTGEQVNETAREIVRELEAKGLRAINVTMGFPMEMQNYPDKRIWTVSHKLVAVASGMGKMGINRNVIHPQFGNFILLGTILLEAPLSIYGQPLDYNPCLSCKLCVAACPVGAIAPDGYFNFSACLTHNYREFMGGFQDWVNNIVTSNSPDAFAKTTTPAENAAMWQSLSFGANYKAAYCMAVCPAGDDVIGQFLKNKQEFLQEVVKPLQAKEETLYVIPGSDAEDFAKKRFPHKPVKLVYSGLNPQSIDGFLNGLRIVFQPAKAKDLNATYHFKFTGKNKNETQEATVSIKEQRVQVEHQLSGKADLIVTAQSKAWLKFLSHKSYLPWALLTGKIKLQGPPQLLIKFGRCFPN